MDFNDTPDEAAFRFDNRMPLFPASGVRRTSRAFIVLEPARERFRGMAMPVEPAVG